MRLTMLSDYALRVLMYAGAYPERLVTIDETLRAIPVSRGHIMKVVLLLGQAGFLRSQRGRAGGFTLALPPAQIRLSEVLRHTEPDYQLVECLGPQSTCPITRSCGLPAIVQTALAAFLSVMDRHTLADVLVRPADFLSPPDPPARRRPDGGSADGAASLIARNRPLMSGPAEPIPRRTRD